LGVSRLFGLCDAMTNADIGGSVGLGWWWTTACCWVLLL